MDTLWHKLFRLNQFLDMARVYNWDVKKRRQGEQASTSS